MRCDDVTERLADYLTGTLSATELRDVQQHASSCAACRAELEGFDRTWRLLGHVPAPAPDGEGMHERFARVLANAQPAVRDGFGRPRAGGVYGSVGRHALVAAAAAAVMLIGVTVGRVTAPSQAADMAALRDELRSMRVMVGLSLMQQTSASERLRGVSWSSQIDQPGSELVEALLDTLMHDPNDNVRLATVDALRRFADREVVRRGAADALLRQTSPLVQIALIDFAVESNDRAASDALLRLSRDPMVNETVRARAARAAQQLG
jgi:putative zinc finger protein